MLCLKPYVLYKENQRIMAQGYGQLQGEGGAGQGRMSYEDEDEEDGVGTAIADNSEEDHVSILLVNQLREVRESCMNLR